MANPIKAIKAVKKYTTGQSKAANRAKKSGISVGLAATSSRKRVLVFREQNYFGDDVIARGGKNSKKFAKLNKASMLSTGNALGVKTGRVIAQKSRKVSEKTLQKSQATMVPRTRSIPFKSKSKVPVKRRSK